jgi:phosphoribosylformylglycinamidine synthase
MTEGVYTVLEDVFDRMEPAPLKTVDILGGGREALDRANGEMGLALSSEEVEYLYEAYRKINRNPSDVELVMFGQVNSEHCRHKIFNADWVIDGSPMQESLFEMIRNTHKSNPGNTLVAYKDNAAVVAAGTDEFFEAVPGERRHYDFREYRTDMVIKVETHNHPTAISPYPGAATGVGGEIRDESATGRGGRSKAGLSAFMVSNLRIPGFRMPWEKDFAEFPERFATPLDIMLEGPIGAARFGNEFGRPQLTGVFRTYEQRHNGRYRGYHKPIMVAGGMGNIKRDHAEKEELPAGSLILQIGGPALRIGLGGGAASSMAAGSNIEDLDFDSVQRDNAEMQRRCQCVIDACMAAGSRNPIITIHDLGAGGLSNGCPELVEETGGEFQLRQIPNEDLSMSPMEIWCCEAQERFVLAVAPGSLDEFMAFCRRERCPAAVIGKATGDKRLILEDKYFENRPIDIDIEVILGKPPRMVRDVRHEEQQSDEFTADGLDVAEAFRRVLRLPAVANKNFLITIADRSVTGTVARDQMTGPWQTPVADSSVVLNSYRNYQGQAMAMGERTPVSLVSAPASGRMAIGEALTNLASSAVGALKNVKLSANWMCACGEDGEDASLYDTVKAVGKDLCPRLGIAIPVGKDSLSMRTVWETSGGETEKMTAPLSLVISAFSPVPDVRLCATPDLKKADSALYVLDLGRGRNRLGGSALAQAFNCIGSDTPDVDDPGLLARCFAAIQQMHEEHLLLAYHDRSDGGLAATLAEMAIAGRRGMDVETGSLGQEPVSALFAEELGAVVQVEEGKTGRFAEIVEAHALSGICHRIGSVRNDDMFVLAHDRHTVFAARVNELNSWWSELTYRMQSLRDNPDCAREEYDALKSSDDPGMNLFLSFDEQKVQAQSQTININAGARPRVAILREQGVNGHVEMAAAFHAAGFEPVDIQMTELFDESAHLADCSGLVACGGFSYGDVLGAGSGWAKSILYNDRLKELFAGFFARQDTFSLGVCNGCQMMSQLKSLIPGAGSWPAFVMNRSEQFEARYVTVEVEESSSVLLAGMAGSRLGIPVAHGEGKAEFSGNDLETSLAKNLVAMRYVDNHGRAAESYPFNPNGSPEGITGLTTEDGRVTIMMPHPERGFRSVQMSYRPAGMFENEAGPWLKMFHNARKFVG